MYLFLLLGFPVVFYLLYRTSLGKTKDSSSSSDSESKKSSFSSPPSMVRSVDLSHPPIKEFQKPSFGSSTAFVPSVDLSHSSDKESQKPSFKSAPSLARSADSPDWLNYVKLFLFCKKCKLFSNRYLFKVLSPFVGISQNYILVPKNEKFYPANYSDPSKLQSYINRYNSKLVFGSAPYFDVSESSYILKDVLFYVSVHFDLSSSPNKWNKSQNICLTDNLSFFYSLVVPNYDKVKFSVNAVFSNDDNVLKMSSILGIPSFRYDFVKVKKPSDSFFQKLERNFIDNLAFGFPLSDMMSVIDSIYPNSVSKKILNLRDKFGDEIRVYSFTGHNLCVSALTFVGKKTFGKDKFAEFTSTLYGIAGAIVAGFFSLGIGAYPAYKLTKAQAKYVLTGSPNDAIKEFKDSEDLKFALQNVVEEDLNFDEIVFTSFEA